MIDRTPQICWEIVRTLSSPIQESFWSVTDDTLEGCMQESSEFVKAYKCLTDELEEMATALQILESMI